MLNRKQHPIYFKERLFGQDNALLFLSADVKDDHFTGGWLTKPPVLPGYAAFESLRPRQSTTFCSSVE